MNPVLRCTILLLLAASDGVGISVLAAQADYGSAAGAGGLRRLQPGQEECGSSDVCGGFAGFQCECTCGDGSEPRCVDDPADTCDPATGGRDCLGMCTCPGDTVSSCDATSCEDCVDEGCAWAAGECLRDCDMIADVSCYSASSESFDGMTAEEICQVEEKEIEDANACSAQSSSCSDCVSTLLPSDETRTCMWFTQDGGFCGSACGMIGCGVFQCHANTTTMDPEPPVVDGDGRCSEFAGSCSQCVNEGCSWSVGQCLESCDIIADAACYETGGGFEGMTVEEICQVEQDSIRDAEACDALSSCTDCVETPLPSNSNITCMWFTEMDFCGSGCGMMGCGVFQCPANVTTIDPEQPGSDGDGRCSEFAGSCDQCISEGCSWSAGQCLESCDIIADAACYETGGGFEGMTVEEICQMEQNSIRDAEACNAMSSCTDCVETPLPSNSDSTCMWFPEMGFCGSGCGMMGCGVQDAEACMATATDPPTTTGSSVATDPPTAAWSSDCSSLSSCTDCVTSDCAWTTGECMEDCLVADAACYTKRFFEGQSAEEICESEGGDSAITDDNRCDSFSFCVDCVSDGCAWTTGECMEECFVQDVSCYTAQFIQNKTAEEICKIEEDEAKDSEECTAQLNCDDCVATILPSSIQDGNGNKTCMWFDDGGYCGVGCKSEGCGVYECPSSSAAPTVGSTPDAGDVNATSARSGAVRHFSLKGLTRLALISAVPALLL